jgi:hypothetical protein
MEELGCVVTALAQQRRLVHEPTLIFMSYADRGFFGNLLTCELERGPARQGRLAQAYLQRNGQDAWVQYVQPGEVWCHEEECEEGISLTVHECMQCVADTERSGMICDLPIVFSIHLFHFDAEIDMEQLVTGRSTKQFLYKTYLFVSLWSWNMISYTLVVSFYYAGNCTKRVWSTVNIKMNYDAQLAT